MVWRVSQIPNAKLLDSAALRDFSNAFAIDKIPHTHMVIYVQLRPGDPVQHLSTDMNPA